MRAMIALAVLMGTLGAAQASGCGSRGGPGYRGPDGRCVGWAQLSRKCGSPPTERCTFEGRGGATEDRARDFVESHERGRTRGGARPEFATPR